MMLLTLFRHGEVEGRPFVFRGRSDPPLSSAGWTQLRQKFAMLNDARPDRLVSSPRRRCLDFAALWSQASGVELVVSESMREIDFGAWEEMSHEEVRAHDAAAYERFLVDPERWCSPGGENYASFRERVLHALDELRPNPKHTAILTHAGVMRIILCETLQLTAQQALRIALPPASTCRIWYDGSHSQLLSLHGALQ